VNINATSFRRVSNLLALLSSLVILGACEKQAPEQATEPPAVGVIEVTEQKVNPYFEFIGKTRAPETVTLRARVTGFLESREFQEGGKVEAGQVLFKIEPEQYQATLAQTEAELAAAKASLKRAEVDRARYEELLKTKNVSQQKVDEAEAEVLVQEAAVQTAEAAIRKARLDVDYTEIKAPISGRIDIARLDVGNLVGPESGTMAIINKMDPIKVAFSISETWFLALSKQEIEDKRRRGETEDFEVKRAGDEADEFTHVPLIRLPDGAMYDHPGVFDFIDNKVDEKTGTVLVRAEFPNPDRLLLPGQFVTVVIERKEATTGVVIPQAAVLTDQAGAYVLVVNEEDEVEIRRIETGQRFGPNWLVEKGLETGERIVLFGVQKVRPGIKVKPELTEVTPAPMEGLTSDGSGDVDFQTTEAGEGQSAEGAVPTAPSDSEQ
jgi:membrane fusion protein (multidrug efflux system)